MRKARPSLLLGAASAAALIVALCGAARAEPRPSDVRRCATQTEELADQRIAGCTAMVNSGRLHGKPAGVAYELRA